MRPSRTALAAATLALALTGCGGEQPTSAAPPSQKGAAQEEGGQEGTGQQPENPVGGPGTYTGSTRSGLTITAEVPTKPTDPQVAEIEKYRKAAGAPAFSYIVAEYDNTQGRKEMTVWEGMNVVTEDGQTVPMMHIAKDGGVLETEITDEINGPLNDKAWDYYTGFYDFQSVRPGAKETVILASTDQITSVGRVFATIEEYGPEIMLTKE